MGMVIYQPNLTKHRVSPIAEEFCRLLAKQYRVSLFDQLVYQQEDIIVSASSSRKVVESREALTVMWFDLCVAASVGDIDKVCRCECYLNFTNHHSSSSSSESCLINLKV